jgi:hypothetical protein
MIETEIPNSKSNSEMRNQAACATMFPESPATRYSSLVTRHSLLLSYIWPNAEVASIEELGSNLSQHTGSDPASCEVLCIFMKARHEKLMRKALARASFSEFTSYALVPNSYFPRWFIPLESSQVASASLQLYNPQSLKGKGVKWIVGNLACFGILNVWGRDRLLIASKGNGENTFSFLTDLLGVDSISVALSTGTPGYYRKMTAQLMSKDGHILAYAKIAVTQQARRMLRQEIKVLQLLAKLSISSGHVPGVIYAGQFHESALLVQSAPSVKPHKGPKELGRRHIEFLAEIFNQTSKRESILKSEYWLCIRSNFESLCERISDDWQKRLQKGIDVCESLLVDETIPLGLCHRDFVPWNTYLQRDRLYVFDWEYAAEQGIPFWDIFHFVFFPAILITSRSGEQLIDQWQSYRLRQFLAQYAESIGIDLAIVPVCFLLYLIEVSCFHLDMFDCDGLQNTQRQRLQETWANMMDELVNHWEEYQNQWR